MQIFYSWQSDLDPNTNSRAIRNAIQSIIPIIEDEIENCRIILEEATSREAGSPDIPSTIFRKIGETDIFICDITTINNDANCNKKTPNPNVLIELGYAISVLGWERIIMLYNTNYGAFPQDLPFDLDRRRISTYRIINNTDQNGRGNLKNTLKIAVKTIIEDNPQKNIHLFTPEEIRRNNDIVSLQQLFSTIHLPTLDLFIERAPRIVDYRIIHYYESFNGIFSSSLFHIYDEALNNFIIDFYNLWRTALSFGDHYLNNGGNTLVYGVNNDEEERQLLEKLEKNIFDLSIKKSQLLVYVRTNYLEVDLRQTSIDAYREYITFNRGK
jgi:hypothetical protein